MQQNKHNYAKLLHEFQFDTQPKICRKFAGNKSATNPPEKYSAGRIDRLSRNVFVIFKVLVHDLDLTGSHDVIGHVIIGLSMCDFLLVVYMN